MSYLFQCMSYKRVQNERVIILTIDLFRDYIQCILYTRDIFVFFSFYVLNIAVLHYRLITFI